MSPEMSNESHRHSGFAGPNSELDDRDRHNSTCTNFPTSSHFITPAVGVERRRPESTCTNCTNFPTSAHFITPAVPVDSGTHESICTNFPNSSSHANPLGGFPQEGISTEDVTQHNCINASNDLLLRSPSQLSKPMSHKRLPESQSGGGKRLMTSSCANSTPWGLYNKFAELGTSGTTYLALGPLDPSTAAELVVVKKQRAADSSATKVLTQIHHENIVSLINAYLFSGNIFFVYERMDISLTRLNACCVLKEEHIAVICRGVLVGLKYIHGELKISTCKTLYDNTFLNYSGYVKIGNIGTGLLAGPGDRGRQDISSVGNLMLHIMQPGTMFRNPQEENLQNPGDWSASIVNFWNATKTSPIEDLLDHPFLTAPLSRAGLAPLVWEADKRVKLHWKKAT